MTYKILVHDNKNIHIEKTYMILIFGMTKKHTQKRSKKYLNKLMMTKNITQENNL